MQLKRSRLQKKVRPSDRAISACISSAIFALEEEHGFHAAQSMRNRSMFYKKLLGKEMGGAWIYRFCVQLIPGILNSQKNEVIRRFFAVSKIPQKSPPNDFLQCFKFFSSPQTGCTASQRNPFSIDECSLNDLVHKRNASIGPCNQRLHFADDIRQKNGIIRQFFAASKIPQKPLLMTVYSALNSSQAHNQDAASKRNPFFDRRMQFKQSRLQKKCVHRTVQSALAFRLRYSVMKIPFSVDSWWMHYDLEEKRAFFFY
ncbi:hypothetical protein CEXT_772431 [Caerostris extrusa]|uniref:Uncharacterized protein n=1 Tax=Caerostris extrusa TaxID=172846 RepID=A0AAV4YCF6_CAEEX|nr:hypothetical protein CEXT_772431 [Caerostris extrusa]